MRTDRVSVWIAVALVVAACGGDSVTEPDDRSVASVSVAPAQRTVVPGDTLTLFATARDAQGRTLSGRAVSWQSLNPSAAIVSTAGLVQAVSAGTAVITATVESKHGSAEVTVEEHGSTGPVATVDVSPGSADVEEGELLRFQAMPRDAAGKEVSDRPIQWISEDPGIAYITAGGELWALRPGTVTITARTEGKSGSATVSVWANFEFDLLYDGWSGVPGVGPELFVHDVRQVNGAPLSIAVPGYGGTGDPTPSPDGSRIAFVRYSSYGDTDIFVVNRDGTGLTQLTTDRAFDDQPAWSPDGQQIAFRRWPQSAGPDIWVMDASDGGNAMNLTRQEDVSQNSPAWSPLQTGGGYRIAYVQSENGEGHVWSMKSDGTDRRQITSGPFYDDQPSWSPDGSTIAFQRNGVAVFGDIYLADAVGGNERWLVSLAFGQFAPAWSPDGNLIAFASKHEGGNNYQIYTVRLDGRPVARRTTDTYDKRNPVWLVR